MIKKLLSIALAGLMLISLAACSENKGAENDAQVENAANGNAAAEGYLMEGQNPNKEAVSLGTPDTKLDPQAVYSKLTYTPEMFYGTYRIGDDAAEDKFGKEHKYKKTVIDGEEQELTVLPFEIQAGKGTLTHKINFVKDHNWMRLYFMKKTNTGNFNLTDFLCSYSIQGNKLIVKPISDFKVDDTSNKITYSFTDITWEYTFSFSGKNLTLQSGDEKVTLSTGLDAYGENIHFSVDNYLSPNSKSMNNIDEISFLYDPEGNYKRVYFKLLDGTDSHTSSALLQDNGLFTFTLDLESGAKTYQYVYFYCDEDGIIFTDGTNTYYYNDTYSDRNKNILNDYLTEDQTGKLESLSESQLEAIVTKKENLMDDLAKAFNDAGIKVTVDEKTGELAMDSSILFGGDSAVLTAEGKAFLNKFLKAYTSIVFSEKYSDFVSKTMVEGHTAPVAGSTYESGLPLSNERANNVKNYCLSAETGVDTTKLASALQAVGYSNSKPITDAQGNVDAAASRRVSFRFIINLEQK